MDKDQLYSKLEQAQSLLSEVYHFAQNGGFQELEHLMSVADTCIIDALETDWLDNS